MRLNRFFTERKNLRIGSSVKLNDSDITHIKKVLRLEKGDKIIIFNGDSEYTATLTLVKQDVVLARLDKLIKVQEDLNGGLEITLLQGLLRAGKFDTIIEKTTELGVKNIVPIECDFSQSKVDSVTNKYSRWNNLAMAASKQSERIDISEVLPAIKFKDLPKILDEFKKVYFFTIPRENINESLGVQNLKDLQIDSSIKKIAILVGPEGGFSPLEHKMALDWGFSFVNVNTNVLKAETAAIFFTGLIKFLHS